MTLSQEFLDYYNQIDHNLKKQGNFDSQVSFTHKVKSSTNKAVKYSSDELVSLGELRNAIVHNPRIGNKAIAEPHEATVQRIKELHKIITAPETVFPQFQSNILGAQKEDFIHNHLIEMKKHSYSQFPVFDEKGAITELINTNTIARWLSSQIDKDGAILTENVRVEELLPEIEFKENFKIIPKKSSIYDAYDIFIDHVNKHQRNLDAIFISETGKRKERPLGIITIEDIAGKV